MLVNYNEKIKTQERQIKKLRNQSLSKNPLVM